VVQHAGDTGYIPKAMTHYVENVGKDDVIFIEVLQADHFSGMFEPSSYYLFFMAGI
jgi:oxalate decarboxylase/phosphoglucose isomerase-like protein (cupin superfamily)